MLMNSIQKDVDSYYTDRVKTYGATPKGVDWNGEQSQLLRFKQLSKIIKKDKFTIADIGWGVFNISLIHDYDLYEFTILVTKD